MVVSRGDAVATGIEGRPCAGRLGEPLQTRRPTLDAACLIGAVYLASFFLPVTTILQAPLMGWQCFWIVSCFVPMNPISPSSRTVGDWLMVYLGWLPNPLLWAGLVLLASGKLWQTCCCAGVCGLFGVAGSLIWALETGRSGIIFREHQAGYYVWMASMGLLALAGFGHALWFYLRPGSWARNTRV